MDGQALIGVVLRASTPTVAVKRAVFERNSTTKLTSTHVYLVFFTICQHAGKDHTNTR